MAKTPTTPRISDNALAGLQKTLNYEFRSYDLLVAAMTHGSAETKRAGLPDNERLEFLGDRVLGFLTADALLTRFPYAEEGDLALRLNALVRRETLADVAQQLGLPDCLVLAAGEEQSGGRRKPALLADACEALIAALYLDGGLKTAKRVFDVYWGPLFETVTRPPKDAKTFLQEWSQADGRGTPEYVVVTRSGPDHAPEFVLEVSLEDGKCARGKGGSKREAEQAAAEAMIEDLGLEND